MAAILPGVRAAVDSADPASLKWLLDDLRDSLARPLRGAPVGSDYPAVLKSLNELLRAVERDPSPRALTGGGRVALFAAARLASIRDCVEHLPALLLRHVQRTLAPDKIAVLRTLLAHPVPDFLDMFEKGMHENTNSSVLAWLLDPRTAPTIGPAALTELVARLENGSLWQSRIRAAAGRDAISVQRECPVTEEGTEELHPGRIDLVVWGPDFVLAIENKVQAKEHDNQTSEYWAWLANQPLHRAHAGLFLSPTGLPAFSEHFKPVSYLELLACLLAGPVQTKPEPAEELVLASYVKTLANGLLRSEVRAIH